MFLNMLCIMSNDFDLTMNLNDTLELDAIIQEWNSINDIANVKTTKNHSIKGIQTNTVIFDPEDSGTHKIDINGQILKINVQDKSGVQIIDNFENGNLSKYSGSTGSFSVNNSGSYKGTHHLQINGTYNKHIYSYPGDGLSYYPKRGDKFELYYYADGFGSGSPPFESIPSFGVSDSSNYYRCFINGNNGRFDINRISSGNSENSDFQSVSYPSRVWLRIEIDFGYTSSDIVSAKLERTDTNTVLANVSITDTEYDSGGIGFEGDIYGDNNKDRRVDYMRKLA